MRRGVRKKFEHLGKFFKQEIKLGIKKLYSADDSTKLGDNKTGFVQQAMTRVVGRKEVGIRVPSRPPKRVREVEESGRKPRLLTKSEVKHA